MNSTTFCLEFDVPKTLNSKTGDIQVDDLDGDYVTFIGFNADENCSRRVLLCRDKIPNGYVKHLDISGRVLNCTLFREPQKVISEMLLDRTSDNVVSLPLNVEILHFAYSSYDPNDSNILMYYLSDLWEKKFKQTLRIFYANEIVPHNFEYIGTASAKKCYLPAHIFKSKIM